MSDSVVHFELPADDLERAQGFYGQAFGWDLQSMPGMGYTMVNTTPTDDQGAHKDPGAINGGMLKRESPVTSPSITIDVDDIDKTLETINANGGSTVQDKKSVMDMGFSAYFKDSEGNLMGLWETAR